MSRKQFFLSAAPLFLVIFIDSMGLGLVFPILNALIMDTHSNFISSSIAAHYRSFVFGTTIAIFMFCWFFGAAILGDLSDQVGRKKSLMICLLGSFFGYLLSALGVLFFSFTLLLIGRVVAGFTAGSQAIAQAAIVDLSTEEHKARNLGWMLFIVSLGFIFGPLAGGILSDSSLYKGFNFATPFYFAAILSLLNAFLLQFTFKETSTHLHRIHFHLHHAITIFISAFKNEKVRELSIILLVLIFGWSSFYSFISMFLLHVYQFTPLTIGYYMGVMGLGFGIGTGLLVEPFTKWFALRGSVTIGAMVAAFCSLLTLLAPSVTWIWIAILPLGAAMAIAYSTLLTLFSNQVDEDSQGWVMGITGSIMAFAFGLNGLLVGLLSDYDIRIPLLISTIGMALAGALMVFIYKSNGKIKAHRPEA